MKVLKIEGVKGMITMAFIGVCLFAGFVIFPGYVAMSLWNYFLAAAYQFPVINIFQGVLLWGILVVTYCIVFNNGLAVSFIKNPSELSEAELNMIMQHAKMYSGLRNFRRIKPNENPYEINNQNISSDDNEKKISNS